jgi:DNA-binding transcriptional ArsR family regulator
MSSDQAVRLAARLGRRGIVLVERSPVCEDWSVRTNGNPTRTVSQGAPLVTAMTDRLLDALGDRTRRAILERLRDGPQPVVEIARGLPVGRPAVSQHLKLLKEAGLVTDEAIGTRRLYEINPEAMAELERYARSFWSAAMTRYARAARRGSTTRARSDE